MTTKVKVINDAMQLLGQAGISSLDENNQFTKVAIDQYDNLVATEIAQANWRFATKFVELSRLVEENPTPYYKYIFQLPADYVALWRMEPPTRDFENYANDKIYSNVKKLSCEYRYVPEEAIWPPGFANYISAKLAKILALTVVRNTALATIIQNTAIDIYKQAIYIDNQSRPNEAIVHSPIISARTGGIDPRVYNGEV